jgi:hypothetical protein
MPRVAPEFTKNQVVPIEPHDNNFMGSGNIDSASNIPTAMVSRDFTRENNDFESNNDITSPDTVEEAQTTESWSRDILSDSVEKKNSVMCLISKTIWKWSAIGTGILSIVLLIILIVALSVGSNTVSNSLGQNEIFTSTTTTF